jgi:hypothetical protein
MKRYIEGGFASAFEAALHVIATAMAIWTNRFCNEKYSRAGVCDGTILGPVRVWLPTRRQLFRLFQKPNRLIYAGVTAQVAGISA